MTPAFLGFGAALRKLYGKPTVSPNASVQVERLGYTTVGHFFYGIKKNATMETTLIEVNEAAKKAKPPTIWLLSHRQLLVCRVLCAQT